MRLDYAATLELKGCVPPFIFEQWIAWGGIAPEYFSSAKDFFRFSLICKNIKFRSQYTFIRIREYSFALNSHPAFPGPAADWLFPQCCVVCHHGGAGTVPRPPPKGEGGDHSVIPSPFLSPQAFHHCKSKYIFFEPGAWSIVASLKVFSVHFTPISYVQRMYRHHCTPVLRSPPLLKLSTGPIAIPPTPMYPPPPRAGAGGRVPAAGLRAGRPTIVVPFFGDQAFWGRVVHGAGLPYFSLPVGLIIIIINALMTTA